MHDSWDKTQNNSLPTTSSLSYCRIQLGCSLLKETAEKRAGPAVGTIWLKLKNFKLECFSVKAIYLPTVVDQQVVCK